MTAILVEKRRDSRAPSTLPVVLENTTGVLRDISASSAFFWTRGKYTPGEPISFAVELNTDGNRVTWRCKGAVVRTQPLGYMVGVAATITESNMEGVKGQCHSHNECSQVA